MRLARIGRPGMPSAGPESVPERADASGLAGELAGVLALAAEGVPGRLRAGADQAGDRTGRK
jgi:hypothetical protein